MLPQDPIILLSYINVKLRDHYSDLDTLCEDLEIVQEELVEKLTKIDYYYNKDRNQFK